MVPAYIDTSALVAVVFSEQEAKAVQRQLVNVNRLYASPLLEAELRSTLVREQVSERKAVTVLQSVRWVLPDRPLSVEIGAVLHGGYVRGAELWHLATALFLAGPATAGLPFLTLDERQANVAATLGFPTPLNAA